MRTKATSVPFSTTWKLFIIVLVLALMSVSIISSAQTLNILSREDFPSSYNPGYIAPVNAAFTGKIGNWSAFSSDNKSTAVVKNFGAASHSAPNSAEMLTNSNAGGSASSYTSLTSPEVSLSGVICTGKIDFFCWIYGEQLVSGNSGTRFQIEFFDGTNWNVMWDHSPNWILNNIGSQTWSQIYIMLPPAYHISNFKYRFRLTNPAGNPNTTRIRVDDCEIYNYTCAGKASLGDFVWADINGNGKQDGGAEDKGVKAITVSLINGAGAVIKSTVTGDDGGYHFLGIDPGTYTVRFNPVNPGYLNSPRGQGNDPSKDSDPDIVTGEVSVTLAADENNTTIDFGLHPTPLPIKLVAFNAVYDKNTDEATLLWRIENSDDVERFILERSLDGRSFAASGQIRPATDQQLSYRYTDNLHAVSAGIIYYRLAMIEKNGGITYSNTVVVRRDMGMIGSKTLQLLPNPALAASSVRFQTAAPGTALVKLTDMTGRVLMQFESGVSGGINTIQLNNLGQFKRGFYMVHVQLNEITMSSKLVIQ